MNGLRAIVTLFFILQVLWFNVYGQSHSIELTYGIGWAILADYKTGNTPAVNNEDIYYKYLGKRSLGFSTGIEFSDFRSYNLQSPTTLPYSPEGTTFADIRYSYISVPLQFEGLAGKRRVHFAYSVGSCINFALNYNFAASYSENLFSSTQSYSYSYHSFQPLQIGFLITGLGIQADISKRLYLNCMLENRLYSFLPPYHKILVGDGMFDTLIFKIALGINCKKSGNQQAPARYKSHDD